MAGVAPGMGFHLRSGSGTAANLLEVDQLVRLQLDCTEDGRVSIKLKELTERTSEQASVYSGRFTPGLQSNAESRFCVASQPGCRSGSGA